MVGAPVKEQGVDAEGNAAGGGGPKVETQTPRAKKNTSGHGKSASETKKGADGGVGATMSFLAAERSTRRRAPTTIFKAATNTGFPGSEAVDLTSKLLGAQHHLKISNEDKEYEEALQRYKQQLHHQYPSGQIPDKLLQEFNKNRRITKFQESLREGLFQVVFRDPELMKGIDKQLKEKLEFEKDRKSFLPTITKHKGKEIILQSPRIEEIKEAMPRSSPTSSGRRDGNPFAKTNPHLKFGKELNTRKFEFNVEDYFWKKKASLFGPKGFEAQARFRTPQKAVSSTNAPTLDYKGRINPEMLMQYGGLYNKIQSRKSGLPAAREEEKEVAARVASVFSTYAYKRAPQFSSRSMSPYLLANSFNFDVTEILLEVKAAREKQLQE